MDSQFKQLLSIIHDIQNIQMDSKMATMLFSSIEPMLNHAQKTLLTTFLSISEENMRLKKLTDINNDSYTVESLNLQREDLKLKGEMLAVFKNIDAKLSEYK